MAPVGAGEPVAICECRHSYPAPPTAVVAHLVQLVELGSCISIRRSQQYPPHVLEAQASTLCCSRPFPSVLLDMIDLHSVPAAALHRSGFPALAAASCCCWNSFKHQSHCSVDSPVLLQGAWCILTGTATGCGTAPRSVSPQHLVQWLL